MQKKICCKHLLKKFSLNFLWHRIMAPFLESLIFNFFFVLNFFLKLWPILVDSLLGNLHIFKYVHLLTFEDKINYYRCEECRIIDLFWWKIPCPYWYESKKKNSLTNHLPLFRSHWQEKWKKNSAINYKCTMYLINIHTLHALSELEKVKKH